MKSMNQSFRHYYIHYEDYVKTFKKKIRSSRFRDIQKSDKSPNFGGEKTGLVL